LRKGVLERHILFGKIVFTIKRFSIRVFLGVSPYTNWYHKRSRRCTEMAVISPSKAILGEVGYLRLSLKSIGDSAASLLTRNQVKMAHLSSHETNFIVFCFCRKLFHSFTANLLLPNLSFILDNGIPLLICFHFSVPYCKPVRFAWNWRQNLQHVFTTLRIKLLYEKTFSASKEESRFFFRDVAPVKQHYVTFLFCVLLNRSLSLL